MISRSRRLILVAIVIVLAAGVGAWYLRLLSASVADARHIRLGMTREEAAKVLHMTFQPIDEPRPPAMMLWYDHIYLRDGTVTIVYDEQDRVSGVTIRPMTLRQRITEPFRIQP